MDALAEVLRSVAQGWRLFPCVPRTKAPLLKGWPTLASADPATIRKWAVKHPGANWGVVTGPDSGVFVIDVDGEKGRASLATLEVQNGALPVTLASLTGREDGGEHRWFAWPVDRNLRNSTRKLGDGLHIRAAGGYVIVPPSIHPTGREYRWVDPNVSIAIAPPWLLEMVTTPLRFSPSPATEIGILREGERNDGLFRYGCALRRKGATPSDIESGLLEANTRRCRPPLSTHEVLKIAASAARYPIGGLDPLETAWQAAQAEACSSPYQQFLELCRKLQLARHGLTIALPLKRIGGLMCCDWTQVRRWRKRAVSEGRLRPMERYIAHRRAGHYSYLECPTRADATKETAASSIAVPLGATVPLTNPTSGLVGHPKAESSSGTLREHDADASGYVWGLVVSAAELVEAIKAKGGVLTLDGWQIEFRVPEDAVYMLNLLSEHKSEVTEILRERGGRVASFPHCPRCTSYALYRRNNMGLYGCQTCGLQDIDEVTARRVQRQPAGR